MLRNKNNDGSAIIEFAIVTPILLIFVFAVIEFGLFFINKTSIQNAVSVVANTIQTVSPNSTADDAFKINNDIVKLVSTFNIKGLNDPSNFCGRAFVRLEEASAFIKSDNPCSSGSGFKVGRTDASNKIDPNDTYFVGLVAEIAYTAQTPFAALSKIAMPSSIVKIVVQVGSIPNNSDNKNISCILDYCVGNDGTVCRYGGSTNWSCRKPSGWEIKGYFVCFIDYCVGNDGTVCRYGGSTNWSCRKPSGWEMPK